MMEQDNRQLTLTERYHNFKQEHQEGDMRDFIQLMEDTEARPTSVGLETLSRMYKSISDEIESLSEEDKELIERIYNHMQFTAKKELNNEFSRWDFFKQVVSQNDWSAVEKAVKILDENEARFEEMQAADRVLSTSILQKYQAKDKEDIEELEKILKNEILDQDLNISVFYIDLIKRTINSKLRTIKNRLDRNQDLEFANWLKETRKAKKMTLRELADKSNASISYIQRLENGKRKVPSLPIIQSIAEGLGVPYKEVLAVINGGHEDDFAEDVVLAEPKKLQTLLSESEFKIKGREATREQKDLFVGLVNAVLNENNSDKYDNLVEIPNIVKQIQQTLGE